MAEKSNSKAFGVNDLQPNKSHLVPGKSADGQTENYDPLTTAKHSRDEVDELIALGKKARGESSLEELALKIEPAFVRKMGSEVPEQGQKYRSGGIIDPVIADDFINKLIQDEDFNGRLMDIEKKFDDFEERLVKAFKHMGFNF